MLAKQPKNPGRYSSQYLRPKSSTKFPKVNNTPYQATLKTTIKKERDSSMRISLPSNFNHNKNKYNTLNSFHYQGTLTYQNFAGTNYFTYFPDYKNPHINHNLRKMICEQDKEIAENYDSLKELWEKLGVTEKYINNFDFMINAKCHNRESILEMLYKEKKQMRRFRIELMKVISEINKRENNINELKQYIEAYKEIKILNQMKENKNIENIDDIIKLQNISNVNKDLLEKDIHECLKSIRLRTINVVNKVKKFETLYTELIKAKINMKIIKAKYGFDFNYLKKIKNDLDFLKDSEINNLYHFSPNGGDPFLLNISDKLKDPNDLQQYMSLPISNELLSIVKTYMFKLDTGDDETTTNMNIISSRVNVDKVLSNKNLTNMATVNSKRRTISDINNLRMQLQGEDNQILAIEEEKDRIKGMTSRQLMRHIQRYGRIKRELYPPFNKDLMKEQIQNRIIARIENKISILENEFNIKINEKYKKKEKIIKDEEQTLMNEKNRIEQVGKQEEEERQKREQDYLNSEKEREKRKNNDKKIREENASFMKRDNNIYLTEMELKCMDDVNGKLKEGREKDLVMKREQIENLEEKQRARKEELEKIRKISDDESENEENSDSEEESQTHKKRKKKKNKDNESDSDNNKKDSKNESKSGSKKDSKNESKNEEDESDEDEDDDDSKSKSKSKSKSRKTKSKKKNSSKDDDEDEDDDDEDDDDDDKDDDEDDD